MNTSTFLDSLRRSGGLPLVFRAHGETLPAGYHLTEVKRVRYETVDCGSISHRWGETHFELWVSPLNSLVPWRGHMPAEKFLRIIDRVEQGLPLEGEAPARIHAEIAGRPAALYDITAVTAENDRIRVDLEPDRTRCKAADRQVAKLSGGCCG